MPNGTALNVMNTVAANVENRMRKDPRVVDVGSQVGSEGYLVSTSVSNIANLAITLKPNISSSGAAQFVTQWQGALNGSFGGSAAAASAKRAAQSTRTRSSRSSSGRRFRA